MSEGGATLAGQSVAFTGRLATMTHESAAALVLRFGGRVSRSVTNRTTMLVIGQDGLPLRSDGRPRRRLLKAQSLRDRGTAIDILVESDWLARLGLHDSHTTIHRRYTIVQLVQILGISRSRLEGWVRLGLIAPTETVYRLAYFDYRQVVAVRMLEALVRRGLRPRFIHRSIERLRRWVPTLRLPEIPLREDCGRLFVRLASGALVEPNGQLRFDFDAIADRAIPTIAGSRRPTADELFQRAIFLEERKQYREAAEAYRETIALDPDDPVPHFNLGNVLYQLDDFIESMGEFETATRLDPCYVEAWNNLGVVLAAIGLTDAAITALRQAIQLHPGYEDAAYHLVDLLRRTDQHDEADRVLRSLPRSWNVVNPG